MLANSLCFEKVLIILVEGFSLVKTGNTFHDSDTKLINLKIWLKKKSWLELPYLDTKHWFQRPGQLKSIDDFCRNYFLERCQRSPTQQKLFPCPLLSHLNYMLRIFCWRYHILRLQDIKNKNANHLQSSSLLYSFHSSIK